MLRLYDGRSCISGDINIDENRELPKSDRL